MSVSLTSGALSASPSPLSVGMSAPQMSGALSTGAGGAACDHELFARVDALLSGHIEFGVYSSKFTVMGRIMNAKLM